MHDQARIDAVKFDNEESLLNKENVVGVGVGKKNSMGNADTIIVFVKKKVSKDSLSAADLVPDEVEGVKTDVVEVGDIRAMATKKKEVEKITAKGAHKTKERPICGGISCIWAKGTACTLTAIVWRGNTPYILQNAHCAFPHWAGAKKGDEVWQPSPSDGGKPEDKIGTSFEVNEIDFTAGKINRFDSALVAIDKGIEYKDQFQYEIGAVKSEPRDVSVGEKVTKSGRTTGVATAEVIAVNVTVDVNYGGKVARFGNQIFTENKAGHFISGGDSSSLVVNKDKYPIGQVFAGSSTIGVFSPIKPILDHFKIAFAKPNTPPPVDDGYMAVSLLDIIPESLLPGNKGVNPQRINLRKEPKVANNVIRQLLPGTRVEIVGYAGNSGGYHWARVKILK